MIEKRIRNNSLAVIFIFFLYSLTTLPGHFMNQSILTVILSVIVFFPILANNFSIGLSKSNRKAICISASLLFILALEYVFYPDYSEPIEEAFFYLITIGSIGLFVGSLEFDVKYCFRFGTILAIICFFTSIIFIFITTDIFRASMRFGYAMLPSALWFLLMRIKTNKKYYSIFFIIALFTLLNWGSRGTILVILIFLLLYMFKAKRTAFTILLLIAIPLIPFIRYALLFLFTSMEDITGAKKIGNFIRMLEDEEMEGNIGGRDILYDHCIDLIYNQPFGNGIGFWVKDPVMDGLYPHNIILHIGTEFGIIGLAILFIVVYTAIKKAFFSSGAAFLLFIYFISISIGRLLVSSMYWARPEFWLFISIFICNSQLITNHLGFNSKSQK